ncbi:MAG: molybdenum cofactor guanylyltransferase [Candidatus Bathyarchaeota archaeon]|nr:molybdenum cofactor guanylyltransferase [Candidatus Bathyarchaeota archaeon]
MDKSAIVLAGGFSSRFGQDKGVLELAGKPLIRHAVDLAHAFAADVIVVTSSKERVEQYAALVPSDVQFAVDICELKSPLVGALTGFSVAEGKYALLLPFDMPFVCSKVVSLLFELCVGKAAVVPRWPNGQIEPLHAVYDAELAANAARLAVDRGQLTMRAMIEKLRGVRYVSTLVIEQFDPEFRTFFNINTPLDLKKAVSIMKSRRQG